MAHEDLQRTHLAEGSSDRAFGAVFCVVFLVVAAWPLLNSAPPRWWAAGCAAAFALAAAFRPSLLSRLNRGWMRLGLLLSRVVSPVALALLFYLVVAPTGFVMRLAGKDPLRLRRDPRAGTYWITRAPPGPPPGSMGNQF